MYRFQCQEQLEKVYLSSSSIDRQLGVPAVLRKTHNGRTRWYIPPSINITACSCRSFQTVGVARCFLCCLERKEKCFSFQTGCH